MNKVLASFLFAIFLPITQSPAEVTHVLDPAGKLLRANNIEWRGATYDVEFLDGTCASVFGACGIGDYGFLDSEALPMMAHFTWAFLEQVFTGAYDEHPSLTNGCGNAGPSAGARCEIVIPTGYSDWERQASCWEACGLTVYYVINTSMIPDFMDDWCWDDCVGDSVALPNGPWPGWLNTTADAEKTWARVRLHQDATQVSEPATSVLLALGLVTLMVVGRRAKLLLALGGSVGSLMASCRSREHEILISPWDIR